MPHFVRPSRYPELVSKYKRPPRVLVTPAGGLDQGIAPHGFHKGITRP